ncbi:MAG: hypothetical protein ACRDZQ_14005, partial [Acidimicrobiales bacterium]
RDTSTLATRLRVPAPVLGGMLEALAREGLVQLGPRASSGGDPGAGAGQLSLTAPGRDALDRLVAARREGLAKLVEGWSPDLHAELAQLLARMARDLVADPSPGNVLDKEHRPVAVTGR